MPIYDYKKRAENEKINFFNNTSISDINKQAMKEFFNGKRSDKAKPVVVWACLDGLIAADITDLIGEIRWGGRKPRKGAVNLLDRVIHNLAKDRRGGLLFHAAP